MPTYEITDPKTGKVIELTGDSPPTEQELEDIFSKSGIRDAAGPMPTRTTPKSADFRKRAVRGVAKALPIAGGVAGSLLGAPLGLGGAAAGAGLGAAGGTAYKQILERSVGDEAPGTAAEAAEPIIKTGLQAALVDLGVGSLGSLAAGISPTILQTFSKLPSESIKRAIQRPALIPLRGTLAAVQRNGMRALRSIEESLNVARKQTGDSVGRALEGLQVKTAGKPIFSFREAAEIGEEGLRQLEASDPAVAQALGPSINKLRGQIAAYKSTTPEVSAKLARARIRALDEMVTFQKGGIRPIESDAIEKIVKDMRHALNEEMKDVAERVGYTKLAEANSAHSSLMNALEELGGIFRTKNLGTEELLGRFKRITNKFNQGGVDAEVFDEVAQRFPSLKDDLNKLLDSSAATTFVKPPQGTPSGFTLNAFRVLTHPRLVGATIRGAKAARPLGGGVGPAAKEVE